MGLTYLFISHNLQVVHHIADRVGVCKSGVWSRSATNVRCSARCSTCTRMLLPTPSPIRNDRQGLYAGRRRSAQSSIRRPAARSTRAAKRLSPCDKSRPQTVSFQGAGVCFACHRRGYRRPAVWNAAAFS